MPIWKTLAVILNQSNIEMNSSFFYFNRLPKFVNILKKNLADNVDKNDNLIIKDYIKIFFEFYHLNNAYEYFKVFNPTSDKMYLSIYLSYESKIYIERDIRIEDDDEEYQIQLELILDIPPIENKMEETFEVERDNLGDFLNWEEGYFHFEDYQEKVLTTNLILNILELYPRSIRIGINADI